MAKKQLSLEQLLKWIQKHLMDVHTYGCDGEDNIKVKRLDGREIWGKTWLQALRAAHREWGQK